VLFGLRHDLVIGAITGQSPHRAAAARTRAYPCGDLEPPLDLGLPLSELTESSYDDHSKNALWLGTPVPMRLEILRQTYRTELLPTASAEPA
jgi:hypothetical protein